MRRFRLVRIAFVCIIVVAMSIPALAQSPAATGTFLDDDGSTFEADIEAIAKAGITKGCNPPANDRYCPDEVVTRGQMAAFLIRALGRTTPIPSPAEDRFVDDDGSVFEDDIEKLALLGITRGCAALPSLPGGSTDPVSTPPSTGPGAQLTDVRVAVHDGYDRVVFEFEGTLPGFTVTFADLPITEDPSGLPLSLEGDRAITVQFIYASAFDVDFNPTYTGPDRFTVRQASVREVVEVGDFERVMSWAIGVRGTPKFRITTLTSPTRFVIDVDRPEVFCPEHEVTRGQMAAFLTRAFGYRDDDPTSDVFLDDDGSIFEDDIEALAASGVTKGCNPPANDRFCPDDAVTRGQMAAFLRRALHLPSPGLTAACTVAAIEPVIVAELDPTGSIPAGVDLRECQNGYARAFFVPADQSRYESEQVFLKDVAGAWEILTYGTGIDCATDTAFQPAELEDACVALGLR